ncbi:class I SAM-dependent methyltransferase [Niabella aurantiaca]|uniref:class I SAM-dependent methyltransferase n=1 Tax=Niabella aurantiaca TaxID=379900 RepID=UPI000381D011|nr:class I SAM-dependent methyltransferase [Niabella aurantiaca]
MDQKAIIDFYDDNVTYHIRVGLNERVYSLYKRMIRLGLQKRSTVLELGCSTGTLTHLLCRCAKRGTVEAVDISPGSIAYARQKIRHPNVSFATADIVHYTPRSGNIDFITLFDVLEHIPLAQHSELLARLAALCSRRTRILIHIPNPDHLAYHIKHNAEDLQVIDQPVDLPVLITRADQAGLKLDFLETYGIWHENDYVFLVLSAKKEFEKVPLGNRRTLLQKAVKRLHRMYFRTRYR